MERSNSAAPVGIVTGAASGIGRAIAERLVADGVHVVLADRNLAGAMAAADSMGAIAMPVDVADGDSVRDLINKVERDIGALAIMVPNAGIIQSVPAKPEDIDAESWNAIMAVDLRGVFHSCVEAARVMKPRGRGSIVNIASVTGIRSSPLHAYGPAKAGVIHLTQTLAAEWGPHGIRVNTVSPGYVLTPVVEDAIANGLRDTSVMSSNAALGRMVLPTEIANAVAFLLSDQASAITGINLPVDNGWLVTGSWHTYGGLRQ